MVERAEKQTAPETLREDCANDGQASSSDDAMRRQSCRNNGPTQSPSRGRFRRDMIMFVLGALIAWTCGRLLDTAFPEPTKQVALSKEPTELLWAIKTRRVSDEEQKRLEVIHRDAPSAAVLAIYFKNTGTGPLARVTFIVEVDSAIIAHVLPLGLDLRDSRDVAITDQLRHFAYERYAKFTFTDVPSDVPMFVPFIIGSKSEWQVLCQIDDRFVAARDWPPEAELNSNVLRNLVYERGDASQP